MLDRLKGFSISGEEDILGVENDWMDEGNNLFLFGLVGKMLSKKHIRVEVFKDLFQSMWRLGIGLEIRQVAADSFIFLSEKEADQRRVLANEP